MRGLESCLFSSLFLALSYCSCYITLFYPLCVLVPLFPFTHPLPLTPLPSSLAYPFSPCTSVPSPHPPLRLLLYPSSDLWPPRSAVLLKLDHGDNDDTGLISTTQPTTRRFSFFVLGQNQPTNLPTRKWQTRLCRVNDIYPNPVILFNLFPHLSFCLVFVFPFSARPIPTPPT